MIDQKKLKILITGASGFIGTYLMDYFSKKNYEVVGVVRNDTRIKRKFKYIICDLSKNINIKDDFDIVIHCAAELDHDPQKIKNYIEGNIFATYNLIDYANKHNIKKFINLNSVRSFGKIQEKKISENTPIFTPGYYGITKMAAESLVLDSDIKAISLILPGVVGKDGHTPWIMRISREFLNNRPVDCYDPKALFNNIIHVDTLAECINQILDKEILVNDRVLLGCKNSISKYDVLCILKRGLDSNSEIRIVDNTDISFYLDINKAKSMGFKLFTVEEELNKLIKELKV